MKDEVYFCAFSMVLTGSEVDHRHSTGTLESAASKPKSMCLAQEDGKDRCLNAMMELSQDLVVAVPH